jgi:hypothetical protein
MESTEGDIPAAAPASPTPVPAPPANAAVVSVPDTDPQNTSEVIAPTPSFTWDASEYVFHEKPLAWYTALWVATALLSGGLGLMHQWLSIVVVVVMALAVMVYSRKEPRTLTYALDGQGISIDGKLSSYHLFKSYSAHEEVSWREIDLEPARRFAPRLTVLCEVENFDTIDEILAQHLPRVDRDPDWIEKLTRYIKF